jgi:hypothetical protein
MNISRRVSSTIVGSLLSMLAFPLVAMAAPSISTVSPVSANVNTPTTLSASVSAVGGLQYCRLYVESEDVGPMTINGSTASLGYTFTHAGVHTVFVFCKDNANVGASGGNTSVFVQSSGSSGDNMSPNVSAITPTIATANVAVNLSVTYSDSGTGVVGCDLYVNGTKDGAMTLNAGTASKMRVFNSVGTATSYALCTDGAGNAGQGTFTTVTVSGATTPTPEPTPGTIGKLIKLECPAGSGVDHPCKAVYYVGKDGKRHAFANSKVFFTWYANFNEVETISSAAMSMYPLGKNVTYRPGVRLVKFATLSNVYAVSKGGVLRWLTTETAANSIYGANWNTKVDDIADSFYGDYTFGSDISDTANYNLTNEMNAVKVIDDTL